MSSSIRKAVDGCRPNRQSLNLLAPVPVSTSKIEHRQIVIGIQREGLLIGVDGLRGLAKIAVSRAELKPAHGIRLNALGLFPAGWAG